MPHQVVAPDAWVGKDDAVLVAFQEAELQRRGWVAFSWKINWLTVLLVGQLGHPP